ncbi:hypothetical protein CEXT_577141 [Caerostris extrusa]|uniref:Uncharacterized protein n=1 Tax=Caerostris extrusa TaxID=172846 RepID=A0AAV4N6K9_CAEEX|nr:hypothetical protein CEXT_577141 [Caerostris extrusa]
MERGRYFSGCKHLRWPGLTQEKVSSPERPCRSLFSGRRVGPSIECSAAFGRFRACNKGIPSIVYGAWALFLLISRGVKNLRWPGLPQKRSPAPGAPADPCFQVEEPDLPLMPFCGFRAFSGSSIKDSSFGAEHIANLRGEKQCPDFSHYDGLEKILILCFTVTVTGNFFLSPPPFSIPSIVMERGRYSPYLSGRKHLRWLGLPRKGLPSLWAPLQIPVFRQQFWDVNTLRICEARNNALTSHNDGLGKRFSFSLFHCDHHCEFIFLSSPLLSIPSIVYGAWALFLLISRGVNISVGRGLPGNRSEAPGAPADPCFQAERIGPFH